MGPVQKSLRNSDLHTSKENHVHAWQPTPCIKLTYLYHKQGLWNQNPNFKLWLQLNHLKVFGSSFNLQKLLGLWQHSPGLKVATSV